MDQLFSEAQGIFHMVNAPMKTILKRFGVEEENVFLTFCRDFASKEEIKHELDLFFQRALKHSIQQQSLIRVTWPGKYK